LRITLIHNPHAGGKDHDRERMVEALTKAGHDVSYVDATATSGGFACAGRTDAVVAAGGDGTVRDVFRRMAGT
jgi:diacylglycerol kinase family enzyme